MPINLQYVKIPSEVFETEATMLNVSKMQNFTPLLSMFFNLNESNYESINLKTEYTLLRVSERLSHNKFKCSLLHKERECERDVFIKFAPLLDPVKFMSGKFKGYTSDVLRTLPVLNSERICHSSYNSCHNTAYTDAFAAFLMGCLLHEHNFINGIDFYGTFLANQKDFRINVFDDIPFLSESDFFIKNKGNLFNVDEYVNELVADEGESLDKITILDDFKESVINEEVKDTLGGGLGERPDGGLIMEIDEEAIDGDECFVLDSRRSSSSSCSSCSSCTSHTTDNEGEKDNESNNDSANDGEDDSYTSDESSDDDKEVFAYIDDYPVNMIFMESCRDTLDNYMREDISDAQWGSILMQIVMSLVTMHKSFNMTHNDLHSSNVMYVETENEFLVYCYNNIIYKVPTFGKIWKIIDFGRAIYKFKGKTVCSASFQKDGDAAGQYNCEPFFDENKPRIDPNYSFDLCRFACSLFDYFFDGGIEDLEADDLDDLQKVIALWCSDDSNRNMLYKTNGMERYPEFKLYKMIARGVHRHTPETQLDNPFFAKYQTSKRKLSKNIKIINIDAIPCYS